MSAAETELLRDYLGGSERAFAALVNQHVDLVYSAALRQLRSPQLAEEITQNAFIALARHAQRIKPGTPLVAWLYVVTRRAAIDALRADARRHQRERIASESTVMNSSSTDWSHIEPFLDEAMESLREPDRSAILLRYFDGKSLREVGTALGTSEDAAQKRLSRALEQLRAFFARRGVLTAAGALATSLTAHAVQSAPIGLGLSISSAAAVTGVLMAPVAGGAGNLVVMTTLQKTIVATVAALGLGVGLYEYQVIVRRDEQLIAAHAELGQVHAQMRQLRQERDAAAARWAAMEAEIDAASARIARGEQTQLAATTVAEAEMKAVLDRVAELKRRIAALPGARARGAGVLKKEDWIKVVLSNRLENETDVSKALAEIQDQVKLTWATSVQHALAEFIKTSGGVLPADTTPLAAFLPPGTDPTVLQRFQLLRAGNAENFANDAWLVADIGRVDDEAETLLLFSRGNMLYGDTDAAARRTMLRAYVEFVRAHGQTPTEPTQFQPYLRQPVEPQQLHRFWKQHGHLLR